MRGNQGMAETVTLPFTVMRIAVNGSVLALGTSGSARATQALVGALSSYPGAAVEVRQPGWSKSGSKVANAARMACYDLWQAGRTGPADLLVSACNIGRAPSGVPHLLVVYDALVFDQRASFDSAFGAYARLLIPFSMRRATRILTISEYSRTRLLDVAEQRTPIEVVPLPGRGELRAPRATAGSLTVVMLGATEPHKRQLAGVEAVAALRATSGQDVRLDVIGPPGRAESALTAALDGLPWARRLVNLPSPQVRAALDDALLLLQPSADEGFGLPVVEAGERGIPVVHTSAGALGEVMPAAGVRSLSPAALASGMQALLDPAAWSVAAAAAHARAQDFSLIAYTAGIHAVLDRTLTPAP